MAQRRMMSMHIIDTDAFMDMPHSAQCLYMHMLMRADDDGFVANAKKIMRMVGTQDDDLKILFGKNFVIPFESGVCVIKHWRIHNLIRNDRYNETKWQEEKEKLTLKDNGSYTLDTTGIPVGNQMEPQVRLGKVSKGKVSKEELQSFGEDNNVHLTKNDLEILYRDLGEVPTNALIEELDQYISAKGKDPYKCHRAVIKQWFRRRIQEHANKNNKGSAIAEIS